MSDQRTGLRRGRAARLASSCARILGSTRTTYKALSAPARTTITSGTGSNWFCTETDAENASTANRTTPTGPSTARPRKRNGLGVSGWRCRHLERGQVQVEHGGDTVCGPLRIRSRDETDVGVALAGAQLDRLSGGVRGEGRDTQLGSERGEVVLGGSDPLAAAVDREPGLGDVGERASAHPVPGLEDQDVDTVAGQLPGGGQTGEPGADHGHLALLVQLHRPVLSAPLGGAGPGRPP